MAEAAVSLVLDRLISLLAKEINLLDGVHKQVEDIKDELESIRSFLKDADSRAEKEDVDDTVKTWVKQVREAAHRIEDVVDEYMLYTSRYQSHRGVLSFLKTGCLMIDARSGHKIASKIEDIKACLCQIKDRCERYHLRSLSQGSNSGENNSTWYDPRFSSLYIRGDEVVGIESTRDELVECLVRGASERRVISVVGMGGIGKTTLVKVIYDNEIVRRHFECHAWISVSQSYRKEELLRQMVKQFFQSRKESAPEAMDTIEDVINKLREYLQEKRYVVVFDDVWKVDFWGDIEHALLDNKKGSRVMITTRRKDVAEFCKKSSFVRVHELTPLLPNKAWELFCKKAFQYDSEGNCPPALKKLALDIVKRCGGLPLAIVAIGGLLSTKNKVVSEWQLFYDSLSAELECNPHLTNITKILSLSYHDLPYNLKYCFLYFGIFPEDYSVARPRLIEQWIAEGFVKPKKGRSLEQVANEYLNELFQRNLVQVSWGEFNGVNRKCRVHDLMREIILAKMHELNFCEHVVDKDSDFDRKTRRLAIYNSVDNALCTQKTPNIRCFFLFRVNDLPRSFMIQVFNSFKLMRVLDIEDAPIDFLPEEVGNLFHLRYLSIRNTKIKMLPKSIGRLRNLQTLNVADTLVRQLPKEINKLLKLRNLLADNCDPEIDFGLQSVKGVKIYPGIGRLEELQTLLRLEAHDEIDLIKELGKLTQLRVLCISVLTREAGKVLCASIRRMPHLKALDVQVTRENEILDLQSLSFPSQYLWDLFLRGNLEKLPQCILELQHLVTMGLFFSRLNDDPLKELQHLSNLEYLYLYEAYEGDKLHIVQGGFRKLRLLSIRKLRNLQTLIIDQEALPSLEELCIGPSPLLSEVPNDVCHLKALKTLVFYDMPRQFGLKMRPNGGEDHWKVAHIQTILFSNKIRGERYETHGIDDLTSGSLGERALQLY